MIKPIKEVIHTHLAADTTKNNGMGEEDVKKEKGKYKWENREWGSDRLTR